MDGQMERLTNLMIIIIKKVVIIVILAVSYMDYAVIMRQSHLMDQQEVVMNTMMVKFKEIVRSIIYKIMNKKKEHILM